MIGITEPPCVPESSPGNPFSGQHSIALHQAVSLLASHYTDQGMHYGRQYNQSSDRGALRNGESPGVVVQEEPLRSPATVDRSKDDTHYFRPLVKQLLQPMLNLLPLPAAANVPLVDFHCVDQFACARSYYCPFPVWVPLSHLGDDKARLLRAYSFV